MKRILLLALAIFTIQCSLFAATASAQSRTNRIYRNCPATTTRAQVAIDVAGNIALTPCSGKTTTINGNGNVLTSYLAATVTYNNVAVLADSPLSVSVAASGIYDIELTVHSTEVGKALNLDFGGTATITNFIGRWFADVGNEAYDSPNFQTARSTAAGTDFTNTECDIAATCYFQFKGSVEINAAGTFLLRGAQNAADVSNTTILRGSTLKLTKLN